MSEEPKVLHVNQAGENWEVETETTSVAQTETKEEAIQAAQEAAAELHAELIVVHTSDGRVESELPVKHPEKEKPAGE